MKKNNSSYRHITGYILFLIFWSLVLFWIKPPKALHSSVINKNKVPSGITEETIEIYGNNTISQTFTAKKKWMEVQVFLCNNGETYKGNYHVVLQDNSGTILAEWTKQKFNLNAKGNWVSFKLDGMSGEAGKEYSLKISAPNLSKDDCILATISPETLYKKGQLSISDTKREGTLYFGVDRVYPNVFAIAVFIILGVVIMIWCLNQNNSVERLAPMIIMGTGICMMLIMAPFSSPDDQYHYESSLMVSNVLMGKNDLGTVESEYIDYSGLRSHTNPNSAYVRVLRDAVHPFRVNREPTYQYQVRDSLYMPLAYFPQAVGLAIGRALHLNFSYTYYLGRLFALMAYCAMVCTAIHFMPKKKMLILLCSILPICLQQATAYSYDTMINGLSFIFFAYIVMLAERSAPDGRSLVRWNDVIVIGILGGLLSPIKLIYFVSMLAFLVIPVNRFISKKDKLIKFIVAVFIALGIIFITEYPTITTIISGNQLENNVSRYTLGSMMAIPLESLKIIVSSVESQIWGLIEQSVGSSLAGLNLFIPKYIVIGLILLVLVVLAGSGENNISLHSNQRRILFFISIVELVGVFLGMMIGWTQYGNQTIEGVQGRYFIPFMVPFLLSIEPKNIHSNVSNRRILGCYWIFEIGIIITVLNQIVA